MLSLVEHDNLGLALFSEMIAKLESSLSDRKDTTYYITKQGPNTKHEATINIQQQNLQQPRSLGNFPKISYRPMLHA